MPEPTLKPPHLLQAQVATFATEGLRGYADASHVLDNIVRLSLGGLETAPGTAAEEYGNFLRSVGGSHYEPIQGRTEMLDAYSEFAPLVEELKGELADPAARDQHPAYLGRGSGSMVFSIETQGKEYAVRIPHNSAGSATVDKHLAAAVLGRGIPHLDQMAAASYEDAVTIAEKLPGQEVGKLTADDIAQITDAQLGELVDTLTLAHARGIAIDPKPSNFLYDRKAGYSVVDYHSSKVASKSTRDQTAGEVVGRVANLIANHGFYGRVHKAVLDTADHAHDLELRKADLGLMRRYETIVEARLHGEDLQQAQKLIESQLRTTEDAVARYSDPEWVARQVADMQERRRRYDEEIRKLRSPDKSRSMGEADLL